LQDYGRAVIVGDASTHGKGTVQSVNQLANWLRLPPNSTNDPGALKLTIKKFYRPSGVSTQLKGVVPDIILPSVFNESKDIGEASLDNPLANDVIEPAAFDHLNLVAAYLPSLREHSRDRVAKEREYDYVREDIQHYKKLQADKTVSLNENQRLKEKEELDARQKSRDNERKLRKEPTEKVYELSLKQAALPGLPPPVQKTNTVAGGANKSSVTNAAGEIATSEVKAGLNEDSEEEKPPALDASLIEAEHILVDYIAMLPKGDVLTAGHKPEGLLDVNRKD